MSTFIGRDAEVRVAQELQKKGHKILALNWRTRRCEIDIVSKRKKIIYCTEVKMRSSAAWGGGLEYITTKKLEQMRFSAQMWIHEQKWGGDVRLLVVPVSAEGLDEIIELDA